MAKIDSIRYLGKSDVYNMEVAEHHNYITPFGTILHNCDAARYFLVTRTLRAEAQLPESEEEEEEANRIESYEEFMCGTGDGNYLTV